MSNIFDSLMEGITPLPSITKPSDVGNIEYVETALPLMDFQRETVQSILASGRHYAYVGHPMGLGKTPIGLSLAASWVKAGLRPILVVVPPSLRLTWVKAVEKFTPWLSVEVLKGKKPPEGMTELPDTDLLILGDSSLKAVHNKHAGYNEPKWEPVGWAQFLMGRVAGLLVDEAHRHKNNSGRGRAIGLVANSLGDAPRVAMSGTPTPNGRHEELPNQIEILGDGAWLDIGGKGQFWNYYAPKKDSYGGRTSQHGPELHAAMSSTWFYRRKREEVIELPNKGRSDLYLEGSGRFMKEYIKAEDDLIEYLKDKQDGKVTDNQIRAEALIRLNVLRRLAGAAKVPALLDHVKELLSDTENGGVFIVAEHHNVMEDIAIGLQRYDPAWVMGGMSDQEKQDEQDAFNSGETRVMIGQITAAGVGLTLHGDGRNRRVVVAQLPWTPAELVQAEDRLYRIGQTRDVEVEIGLCVNPTTNRLTVDERLWTTLEDKNFNAGMLNDGEGEYLLRQIQDSVLDSYRS